MNELSPVCPSSPVVFTRNGAVFANSRDVAAFFEKAHRNVTRDIENLMGELPEGGVLNFEQTPYVDPQNGQTYKSYDMTKDGFTLLAMGFTGPKALAFKLKYIEQFNAMEAALRTAPVIPDLSDPAVLLQLLTDHTAKRLEAEQRAAVAEKKAITAEKQVEKAQETVEAFDRIAGADGTMAITDAAKTLQVRPKDLFAWMRQNKWIYDRTGKSGVIAYQDKIQTGVLEHKVTTISRSDGSEKVVEAVRVTAKGLARLAKIVPGANNKQDTLPIFSDNQNAA